MIRARRLWKGLTCFLLKSDTLLIGGKPYDEEREYLIVTRDFMFFGYDGYVSLMDGVNIDKINENTGLFNVCLMISRPRVL